MKPSQHYYQNHTGLTLALWDDYVANALRTEPPAARMLGNWGVLNTIRLGGDAELPAPFVPSLPLLVRAQGDNPALEVALLKLSPALRCLHAAIGMATELAELRHNLDEENLVEESGDYCWYAALGYVGLVEFTQDFEPEHRFLPFTDEELRQMEPELEGLGIGDLELRITSLGEAVVGDFKRLVFYDKRTVVDRLRGNLLTSLAVIAKLGTLTDCEHMAGLLSGNSVKLLGSGEQQGRYGKTGFSEEAAQARADKTDGSD